jgi:(4S)-4-hydroxy-5-phosphonooxypentane-2,3-dione isomerase
MLKSTAVLSATIVLSVAASVLLPIRSSEVLAQSAPLYINAVDIDVVPGQIDDYLAAVKENGAAAVKQEPGCREFNITVSQKDPNHVFIFEVYDNAAALDAHRQTDHFKKYAALTNEMVAKRDTHPLSSVAMNTKGM